MAAARTVSKYDQVIRPIVSVRIVNPVNGLSKIVLALLDTGSDRDVVAKNVSDELAMDTWTEELTVKTLDCYTSGERALTRLSIQSVDGLYEADVNGALLGEFLTGDGDINPAHRNVSNYPHLADLPFEDFDAELEMIIGIAHIGAWIGGDVRRGTPNQPMGLRTQFGWTIVGSSGRGDPTSISCNALSTDNRILKDAIDKIFYNDFPAIVTEEEYGKSSDNRKAIRLLQESIYFCEERGKFVVALPWKYGRERSAEILNSVDSKGMALKR